VEAWALDFRRLIGDSFGKKMFAAFLAKEHSLENLHFWDACEELKQSPQSRVPSKVAKIKK